MATQEEIVVYVSQGPLAAEVAKSLLEAQGIPVRLRYQSIGRLLGLTVNGLGKVEVLVPSEDADSARDALAADVSLDDGGAETEPGN